MSPKTRAVLTAAVVFAIAMGALERGGWWWAWLSATVLIMVSGRVGLQLLGGVRLSATNRFILRHNRKTRRRERRQLRQQRREQKRLRRRRQQQA